MNSGSVKAEDMAAVQHITYDINRIITILTHFKHYVRDSD